jgi:hypothetical protein
MLPVQIFALVLFLSLISVECLDAKTYKNFSQKQEYYATLTKMTLEKPKFIFVDNLMGSFKLVWHESFSVFLDETEAEMTPEDFYNKYKGKTIFVVIRDHRRVVLARELVH